MFLDVRKVIVGEGIFIIGATLVALGFLFLPWDIPTFLFVLQVVLVLVFAMLGFVLVVYGLIYVVSKGVWTQQHSTPQLVFLTGFLALLIGMLWASLAWILAPWFLFPANPNCWQWCCGIQCMKPFDFHLCWWCIQYHFSIGAPTFLSAAIFLIFGFVQIALGLLILMKYGWAYSRLSK